MNFVDQLIQDAVGVKKAKIAIALADSTSQALSPIIVPLEQAAVTTLQGKVNSALAANSANLLEAVSAKVGSSPTSEAILGILADELDNFEIALQAGVDSAIQSQVEGSASVSPSDAGLSGA